jgi:hypothetical protein
MQSTNTAPAEWITRKALCELLNLKDATVGQYITKGRIPEKAIGKGITKNKLFHLPTILKTQQ